MSRIGKKPITIPQGVEVKIDGKEVTVKGAKGTLHHTVAGEIEAKVEGSEVIVTRPNDAKENRSLHGLTRTLINNMVVGVSEGFSKTLVSASTVEKGFEGNGSNVEAAKKIGATVAERALAKGIENVVFDRGGYIFHGRVAALAEGAREGGLKF